MARLRDEDLLAILGPDYKRKIESDIQHAAPTTPQEAAALRARQAQKLGDLRFTLVAVIITGFCLMLSSYFTGSGLDVQTSCGIAAVVIGVVGMVVTSVKRRALLRPAQAYATQ